MVLLILFNQKYKTMMQQLLISRPKSKQSSNTRDSKLIVFVRCVKEAFVMMRKSKLDRMRQYNRQYNSASR